MWFGLVAIVLLAAVARLLVGSAGLGLPAGDAWGVLSVRADRLAVGVVVGAALAVGGVGLQTLVRNPLAEPFVLGLSTGAAAGIVGQRLLVLSLGLGGAWSGGFIGAAAGSCLCMAVVYAAGRRRGVLDPLGLLLTGVVLSTIFGALIMLAVHLRPEVLRVELSQWMMGHLGGDAGAVGSWVLSGFDGVEGWLSFPWRWLGVACLTAGGLAWLLRRAGAMDVASLSPAEAGALGVDLRRLRRVLFVVSGLLAAGAVVLAGPVAFVGLVCPHVGRLLVGPSHRGLLWASAILGAALVVLADTAGAALAFAFGVGVVPLGVFTAVVGGVAFLWMLRPSLGRGEV
ncbi:MAG: iron ABC transporter permease [Planctomycetota bacterium]